MTVVAPPVLHRKCPILSRFYPRYTAGYHSVSHPRTKQVSGHGFSGLPDATKGSKSCVVVPKDALESFFPCAARSRRRSGRNAKVQLSTIPFSCIN